MSDEERIEQLELENKVLQDNNKGLKTKIDEQSKEIEELKKPKYLLNAKTGEITTINNSEFISKDKIKAEIEELKAEIEELKDESKEYQIGFAQGCYEKDLDWKDKIKAKIEEVEQWELYNMKIPKLSTLDERLGAKIGIKYVLQSLLEKEGE